MADDDLPQPTTQANQPSPPSPALTVDNAGPSINAQLPKAPDTVPNRLELLEQARAFLTSPQVVHDDVAAKRRFLTDKGLTDVEITGLLNELVRT
jgi:hypothetical protein